MGAAMMAPAALAQLNWIPQTHPNISDDIWCVTYANNTFAAVTNQGNLLTSVDGVTWTTQTVDSGVWLVSIAYGNGIWVVVGDNGTIMVSSDLKAWTTSTSPTTNKLNGVLYNGTFWVAVGEAGTIIVSPDAKTWTLEPAIPGVTGFLHGIATTDSNVFDSKGGIFICGANGTIIHGYGTGVADFTFATVTFNTGFVVGGVGSSATSANLEAIYSLSGAPGDVSVPLMAVGADGSIEDVSKGNGLYYQSEVLASAVPADITSHIGPPFVSTPNVDFRGLTYGFGYWVAAGEQGTIFCAPYGGSWQQTISGTTATLLSAAYSAKLQRIVVTGASGTILIANAPPPTITQQPNSESVDILGSASFSVTAGGAPTLTYQWFKDGGPISGATSSTFNLSNIQNADAGTYTVVVANDAGIAISSGATLTVIDIPVINGVPAAAPASIGLPFQLDLILLDSPATVTVTGLPPGLVFNASTNAISGTPTTAGTYSVVINASNSYGSASPVTFAMTVGSDPIVFTTLAGGQTGATDGTGTAAEFNSPNGLAIDSVGNLYVADTGNFTIRKVSPSGVVTTIAGTAGMKGSADGKGAAALFSFPTGIAIDVTGDLYVTDTGNNTIRKIDTTGQTSTIAGKPGVIGSTDGTGSAASFKGPTGIAVDSSGNLYVADSGNDTIREISPAAVVTTLAGLAGQSGDIDAFGIGARFNDPTGLALDSSGNVYVSDTGNYSGREISPTGSVSTLNFPHPQLGSPIGTFYPTTPTFEGIFVDGGGNVYSDQGPLISAEGLQVDATQSNLFEVFSAGTVNTLQEWQGGAPFLGEGPASSVAGLARDNAGILYILVNGVLEKSSFASGPTISEQPANQSAVEGQSVALSVAATGSPTPSFFQWFFNGSIIPGATSATLTLTDVTAAQAGSYSVSVSTAYTLVTSSVATLTVTAPTARLVNISTRAFVGTGANILIPGFVINGSGTETLLIRAAGPSLAGFGVANTLARPVLTVFDSNGDVVASNTGWGSSTNPAQIASVAASVGAFAFTSGSADSAVIVTLPAGAYTVQVSGVNGGTGVALAEVYEVSFSGTRLGNISTRASVGTGSNIEIAGFVIQGSGTEQLLIRADGPVLAQFNVSGVLSKPSLTLIQGASTIVDSNTGWTAGSGVAAATTLVQTFPFPTGSADSALVENLPAGSYTAQISGVNNTTGIALAEVYEVP
jgi:sugar lactone lactonase YvrE